MIWLNCLSTYIQPHMVMRMMDALETFADMTNTIVEATRAPALQAAEVIRSVRSTETEANGIVALEAWMNLQMMRMRLEL